MKKIYVDFQIETDVGGFYYRTHQICIKIEGEKMKCFSPEDDPTDEIIGYTKVWWLDECREKDKIGLEITCSLIG